MAALHGIIPLQPHRNSDSLILVTATEFPHLLTLHLLHPLVILANLCSGLANSLGSKEEPQSSTQGWRELPLHTNTLRSSCILGYPMHWRAIPPSSTWGGNAFL